MKVVVDAMCAGFGGIRTYVEHLLASWEADFPGDDLVVILPTGSDLPTGKWRRVETPVGRPVAVARPWAQTKAVGRLVRAEQPDAFLATLPSTTLRKPTVPTWVVLYDLRHELEPHQFSVRQQLMRRISYGRGFNIADGIISISQRSLDDLHAAHPHTARTPAVVAHLGADHTLHWQAVESAGHAIAFGHHSNKNLDLILDGWRELIRRGQQPPRLLITGISASSRSPLIERLSDMGLADHTEVSGFLGEAEFQHAMASAGMVMFPSSFEGFGLPVVEGMLLGLPVIIGPERATMEVAGGHAVVLSSWTPVAVADAVQVATAMPPEALKAARDHARGFTWSRTVAQTREALASSLPAAGPG